jgi:transcriptional regulator with XRE-family HTH domain
MASLPNYLLTSRKRLALSQEEVGFLIGAKGSGKESTVSREERFIREPSLQAAIAYEVVYGKPLRELFAGLYEEVERDVAERALVLGHRIEGKPNPKREDVIKSLTSKLTD